ncbi:MAG: hypothetical protein CUN56_00510 [Phototrophicales bacterium]|nr:MAG: hypothetical protein CUN56_00510 [Phototrophicales bacterium]
MPRIPDRTAFGSRPIPRSRRGVVNLDMSGAMVDPRAESAGLLKAAKALEDVSEKIDRDIIESESLKAETMFVRGMNDAVIEADSVSYEDRAKVFDRKKKEVIDAATKAVSFPAVRRKVEADLKKASVYFDNKIKTSALKDKRAAELAWADEQITHIARTTDFTDHDSVKLLASVADNINTSLLKSGVIDEAGYIERSSGSIENIGKLWFRAQDLSTQSEIIRKRVRGEKTGTLADSVTPDFFIGKKRELRQDTKIRLRTQIDNNVSLAYTGGDVVDIPKEDFYIAYDDKELADKEYYKYRSELALASSINMANRLPIREAKAALDELKPDAGKPGKYYAIDLDTYDRAVSAVSASIKERRSDPVKWARSIGLIDDNDIDFSSPEKFSETVSVVRDRYNKLAAISNDYGIEPVPLSSDEIDVLKNIYQSGDADAASFYLKSLGDAAGRDALVRTARAIKDKDPVLAVAMAADDLSAAKDILSGASMKNIGVSNNKISRKAFGKLAGVAMVGSDDGLVDAVTAAAKAHIARTGGIEDDVDMDTAIDEAVESAVSKVVGPIYDVPVRGNIFDGWKIVGFRDESGEMVDDRAIERMLFRMDDNAVISMSGGLPKTADDRDVTVDDIFKFGRPVSVGDGEYIIMFPSGYLMNHDKSGPFRLNLKRLYRISKQQGVDYSLSRKMAEDLGDYGSDGIAFTEGVFLSDDSDAGPE